MSMQRRFQIALLGYGILLLSPELGGSGVLIHLAAIVGCLFFLVMALNSAMPGSSRHRREPKLHRDFHFRKLRLATPLPQS
ncbi:MAG TPA: hypothetical protein PLY96_00365 [Chromatiaceae bacterium]|jgi:hypothetical protein|nr:hypothetical protein [Chromatiaceae bacterium]